MCYFYNHHMQTQGDQNKITEKQWSDQLFMGQLVLKNRICLAALTRQRCDPKNGVPTDMVTQYYTQRTGAGLMLTEASAWHQRGQAFPGAANIYNQQHLEGWKKVVRQVHQKNGVIFIQIFHAGRATHQKINGGLEVWGPSQIPCRQTIRVLQGQPYPIPKKMTIDDIKEAQEQFRNSVVLAKQAGFDGIQIHGAHGYLIDSFLRSSTNNRQDLYGGNVVNRCRFCIELFQIALQYFKPWQLGIKISPVSRLRDMYDAKPEQTFSYLLQQLSKRNVGFVEIRESCEFNPLKSYYQVTPLQQMQKVCKILRPHFNGLIIANDSFTSKNGQEYIREGSADMVSFGRLYVSNPDLPERIVGGLDINQNWDAKTFFGHSHGKTGYIDYPFYQKK